jgi:hypothetical protein
MSDPESAEKKAAPPLVKEFKSLVEQNIKGNMQLFSRVNELLKNAGELLGPHRQKSEGKQSALLMRLLEFNLASYEILSSGTLEMLNSLVSAAEASLLGNDAATASATAPKVCGEIQVEVRQGERLKTPFVVENQHKTPLDISFEAGELIATDSPPLPSSHVAFEPATLTLDPQKKAVVFVLINISQAFLVGKTYTSTIRVLGFQGQEVRLALTILPPMKKSALKQKAKPKKQTKASRTTRSKKPSAKTTAKRSSRK